jgi:RNA polymerase sigma-70 factor (ECF subfamily)
MGVSAASLVFLPPAALPRVPLDFLRLQFKENAADKCHHVTPMEKETDEAILHRVGRGDEAAMAVLYDRFAPSLFAIARRILSDEQEARDALQDGFLYIWDKAAEFDPARSKAFTWAVMIFRHKAIDRLRASRRRIRLNETAVENLLDLESPRSERADISLERAESAEAVRRAMRSLPDEQRQCVEWAFLRGLTHLQLSELLGTPLGTVKTNIRRGLMRLRDLLQEGES